MAERAHFGVQCQHARATSSTTLVRPRAVTAIELQGDNNDDYIVELSDDGTTPSPRLWVADPASGPGDAPARYPWSAGLRPIRPRARAALETVSYSLGEVQGLLRDAIGLAASSQGGGHDLVGGGRRFSKSGTTDTASPSHLLGLFFFIALFRIEESKKALVGRVRTVGRDARDFWATGSTVRG